MDSQLLGGEASALTQQEDDGIPPSWQYRFGVRIIEVGPAEGREVGSYGSRGLHALGLVRAEAVAVTMLHVAAGGEIGRHPAVGDQLFVVASGRATVCGADGEWRPIGPGQAAVWLAGEEHTTRAEEDLTAVVVEMETLPLAV